jgi:hypothetical protein
MNNASGKQARYASAKINDSSQSVSNTTTAWCALVWLNEWRRMSDMCGAAI